MMKINATDSQVLVVDIQQKLAPHLTHVAIMVENATRVLKGALLFNVPITIAEQYPKGLGHSVDELKPFINDNVITKESFSCFGEAAIVSKLKQYQLQGKSTLIVLGCEAHVCVLQTVLDALAANFNVIVVSDAVSSRKASDIDLAKTRLEKCGVTYVSTEMLLFEWTQTKNNPHFKEISRLVK